jgi:hypothetical protein
MSDAAKKTEPWATKRKEHTLDESAKPVEQPEETGASGANDTPPGDCQFVDLLRAHGRNLDHQGRLIDLGDDRDYTPSK